MNKDNDNTIFEKNKNGWKEPVQKETERLERVEDGDERVGPRRSKKRVAEIQMTPKMAAAMGQHED